MKLDGTDMRTLVNKLTGEMPYISGFTGTHVYAQEWLDGNSIMAVYDVTSGNRNEVSWGQSTFCYYGTFGNRVIAYGARYANSSTSFDVYSCGLDGYSCSPIVTSLPGTSGPVTTTKYVLDNSDRFVYPQNNNLYSLESSGRDLQLTTGTFDKVPVAILSDRLVFTSNGDVQSVPLNGSTMLTWRIGASESTMESVSLSDGAARSLYSVGGRAADAFIGAF
jgi:hypothetical protein